MFTRDILRQLRANGEASMHGAAPHVPVLKIVNPQGKAIWLLSELDPGYPDHLYGIADLGDGCPLLGWISRDDMENAYVLYLGYRIPLERDPHFAPVHTIDVYALAARRAGLICEGATALAEASKALAWKKGPTVASRAKST